MASQLKQFLKKFEEKDCSNIRKVVLCNEACDLDSAVSAIVYSYLLHSLELEKEFVSVLPVFNIQKKDFPLRTEVQYWLNKYSIIEESLLFRDTFNLEGTLNSGNVQLYLVDHNVLSPKDLHLEAYVVAVIDHHQLERTNTPVYGMIVEPVGSCCTLITEQIIRKNDKCLNEDIAYLLYGTILLDTVNLSDSAKRTTAKDLSTIEYLESFLNIGTSKRTEIFNELMQVRTDISKLNSEQILRKDVKFISAHNISIAVASVPLSVKDFLKMEDIDIVMENFLEHETVDILVIMGINIEGEVKRDLAVMSDRKSYLDELSSHLLDAEILELKEFDADVKKCLSYNQGNVGASRKVVLPLIRKWVEHKR